ncbi:MAG: hypothetical protein R3C20_19965 [Planctomycetaceae bacterium]
MRDSVDVRSTARYAAGKSPTLRDTKICRGDAIGTRRSGQIDTSIHQGQRDRQH